MNPAALLIIIIFLNSALSTVFHYNKIDDNFYSLDPARKRIRIGTAIVSALLVIVILFSCYLLIRRKLVLSGIFFKHYVCTVSIYIYAPVIQISYLCYLLKLIFS